MCTSMLNAQSELPPVHANVPPQINPGYPMGRIGTAPPMNESGHFSVDYNDYRLNPSYRAPVNWPHDQGNNGSNPSNWNMRANSQTVIPSLGGGTPQRMNGYMQTSTPQSRPVPSSVSGRPYMPYSCGGAVPPQSGVPPLSSNPQMNGVHPSSMSHRVPPSSVNPGMPVATNPSGVSMPSYVGGGGGGGGGGLPTMNGAPSIEEMQRGQLPGTYHHGVNPMNGTPYAGMPSAAATNPVSSAGPVGGGPMRTRRNQNGSNHPYATPLSKASSLPVGAPTGDGSGANLMHAGRHPLSNHSAASNPSYSPMQTHNLPGGHNMPAVMTNQMSVPSVAAPVGHHSVLPPHGMPQSALPGSSMTRSERHPLPNEGALPMYGAPSSGAIRPQPDRMSPIGMHYPQSSGLYHHPGMMRGPSPAASGHVVIHPSQTRPVPQPAMIPKASSPHFNSERLTLAIANGQLWGPRKLSPENMENTYQFELKEEHLSRIQSRNDLEVVLTGYLATDQFRLCNWPDSLQLWVNGQPMALDRSETPNSYKAHMPVNIKRYCRVGINTIQFSVDPFAASSHLFSVYMVHMPELLMVMQGLMRKRVVPAERTKGFIAHALEGRPSMEVSLVCPFSQVRIQTPARTESCMHVQPFELENYLRTQAKWPQFICPICGSTEGQLEKLLIDEYFMQILRQVDPSVTKVAFHSNGTWQPLAPVHNMKSQQQPSINKPTVFFPHGPTQTVIQQPRPVAPMMNQQVAAPMRLQRPPVSTSTPIPNPAPTPVSTATNNTSRAPSCGPNSVEAATPCSPMWPATPASVSAVGPSPSPGPVGGPKSVTSSGSGSGRARISSTTHQANTPEMAATPSNAVSSGGVTVCTSASSGVPTPSSGTQSSLSAESFPGSSAASVTDNNPRSNQNANSSLLSETDVFPETPTGTGNPAFSVNTTSNSPSSTSGNVVVSMANNTTNQSTEVSASNDAASSRSIITSDLLNLDFIDDDLAGMDLIGDNFTLDELDSLLQMNSDSSTNTPATAVNQSQSSSSTVTTADSSGGGGKCSSTASSTPSSTISAASVDSSLAQSTKSL